MGAGTLEELHRQREVIGRTRERLDTTDSDLKRSLRILRAMIIRYVASRCRARARTGRCVRLDH